MRFNLADLFESVADAVGEREALVCGDRRLTYAELDERATRLANHLAASGVKPGEHVGLYLYNCTEYVEAMIGCLKIRAVPINVNYRYVSGELRYLFDDADLTGLLYEPEFATRVDGARSAKLRLVMTPGEEYEAALAKASPKREFPERSEDDLFIIYTGGTTGMPKGVMWRQEDLFFSGLGGGSPLGQPIAKPEELAERAVQRQPQIVQSAIAPLIHGAAQLGVFIGLDWGDKVVLLHKFDPDAVWDAVEHERVNTITVVGDAMARPLAEALAAKPRDVTSLVYFGSAGAVLSEAVKQQLRELLPNCIVTENFGASETGHQGTASYGAPPVEGGGLRFMMMDTTTVLDDDLKRIEPGSGVVGRLAMRGHVPVGYYKDPEKTARTFVEIDGVRWVLPGDLATVDSDGSVIVFGRGSGCINSGGEKIYPEEVEAAVRAHPDVYDAVVVGVPDEKWGERVAAVVQAREGRTPTLDDIATHCRTLIAGYKVPRSVVLVDQMVRHPSGKPDFPWAKKVASQS